MVAKFKLAIILILKMQMSIKKLTSRINLFLKKKIKKLSLKPVQKWLKIIIIYLGTFLIPFLLISIIDHYMHFFNLMELSNPNSARYLLSSLIQSQAAIIAIVVSITLIAVQSASSSYSPRVIEIFQRNADFYLLLLFYGFSIFYISGTLKIIPDENIIFFNQTALHTRINFTLVISFFTFTMLIPYILRILNLLKPSNIIQELAHDITKEKIIKSTNTENKNVANPLVPILDIIRSSCLRHDFETTRNGLKEIEQSLIYLFESELSEPEIGSITLLFVNELESFGKLSVDLKDDNSSKETVKVLQNLNIFLIEKNHPKFIRRVNISLKSLGIAALEKDLIKTSKEAINSINKVGKISMKINSEISDQSIILLKDLARSGTKYEIEKQTYKTILYIRHLGLLGLNERKENTALKALWSLKLIGKDLPIYTLKIQHEEWEEYNQTSEFKGEIYEETTVVGGVEYEISLFDEIVRSVYYIGGKSIKVNFTSVSKGAINNLGILGKAAIKNKYDNRIIPIYLGHIAIKALEIDNEELSTSSVEALGGIIKVAKKNFNETVYYTAESLIRVGTIALQKDFIEIASFAALTLKDLGNKKISTNTIDHIFDGISLDTQEFKKFYISLKINNS